MELLTAPGLIELDAEEMATILGAGDPPPVIDIWTTIRDIFFPFLLY